MVAQVFEAALCFANPRNSQSIGHRFRGKRHFRPWKGEFADRLLEARLPRKWLPPSGLRPEQAHAEVRDLPQQELDPPVFLHPLANLREAVLGDVDVQGLPLSPEAQVVTRVSVPLGATATFAPAPDRNLHQGAATKGLLPASFLRRLCLIRRIRVGWSGTFMAAYVTPSHKKASRQIPARQTFLSRPVRAGGPSARPGPQKRLRG